MTRPILITGGTGFIGSYLAMLDDSAARSDWGWVGAQFSLDKLATDFMSDVITYPDRIKSTELFGS
jgi:thioester reductase-like protein